MKMRDLFFVFALVLLFNSCKKDSEDKLDNILISSVSPTTGLINGQLEDFTVNGSYLLSTHDTAIIMIGFNNGDNFNHFIIIKDSLITKGSGQFNFSVISSIKDWGQQSDFSVYVNLSPYPKPTDSWSPYCSNIFKLIPKK